MFERQVAGGRFEGVRTMPTVYGAHWAAVYISKTEKSVKYFDPEGTPPPCSLEILLGKLAVRVGREVGGSAFRVMKEYVHQKGGAKCGLYSLTYIFRRLTGTKCFMDFSEGPRIGDEELADVAATLFECDLGTAQILFLVSLRANLYIGYKGLSKMFVSVCNIPCMFGSESHALDRF
jgi:hypothetical protein